MCIDFLAFRFLGILGLRLISCYECCQSCLSSKAFVWAFCLLQLSFVGASQVPYLSASDSMSVHGSNHYNHCIDSLLLNSIRIFLCRFHQIRFRYHPASICHVIRLGTQSRRKYSLAPFQVLERCLHFGTCELASLGLNPNGTLVWPSTDQLGLVFGCRKVFILFIWQ
jgi:hypothetical protein